MIRWTGLAPWELEFSLPGILTSTFLYLSVTGYRGASLRRKRYRGTSLIRKQEQVRTADAWVIPLRAQQQARPETLQGYLADKKMRPPLGLP